MKKNWTIFNGLLAAVVSLVLMAGCSDDHNTSGIASGKVVQSPVQGAIVFLDMNGNRVLDDGEPKTSSLSDGTFSLKIPDDKEGMLCTSGGILIDSKRPALPMLAPRDAKNITPLTTLVGISPDLRAVFGENWWDADISQASGVPGSIMQLALAVESFQSSLKSLNSGEAAQFQALTLLATNLSGKIIKVDAEVNKAFEETMADLKAAGKDLPPTITMYTSAIIASIDGEATVVESVVKPLVKAYIPSSPAIAFLPSTNISEMVMPMPNDVVWAGLGGKLPTAGVEDVQKVALYTAVNKLGNQGLSPNTPIAVPLSSATALNPDALKASILILNLSTYQPETDIIVMQDGDFIKIYPSEPFSPGTRYAVAVIDNILLAGSAEEKVNKNPLFEILKSTNPLYQDESSASSTMKSLETIRLQYAPLFDALTNMGLSRDKILTLFTFTTASKTLSTSDFMVMLQTIAAGADPEGMTITGLDYSVVTNEYISASSVVPMRTASMAVDNDSFTSWDFASIAKLQAQQMPDDVDVPYAVYNGSSYSDTVVVYQHGFSGIKEQGYALAQQYLNHPVVAMDLPFHGDRDSTPDDDSDSGSNYLTSNIAQDRINLYQSFFDMSVFIQGLKAGKFDINGDGTPDAPSKIYFTGLSLGSITGSVVANTNASVLDKVVLNVGGANFASIFDTVKNEGLKSVFTAFGIEKNTPEYFVTLGVLQLLVDPADPSFLAGGLASRADTVLQFAFSDTVVSNISNQILANICGSSQFVNVTEFSSHSAFESSKSYLFGGALDKTANWIPHGFLLDPTVVKADGTLKYPEAEGYMDADYASEAHSAVISWTTDYLN
ncbi:MAG: hypothetical protein RBR08_09685 [Desulforegulaceae bacterium]|nr:hypothetical protein [Desulforegulaceae bacterium]